MVFEEILFKGAVRAVGGVLDAKQRQAEFRAMAGAGSLGEILDDVKRASRDPVDLDRLATQLGLRWEDLARRGVVWAARVGAGASGRAGLV